MADGEVKIEIVADDSDVNKKLKNVEDTAEDASGGLDKLGDSAEDAGKDFGAADVAIGTFISNGLSTLVSKAGEAIGSIIALADETREYREDMAKLDTAFAIAGHSQETASKAYSDFYRILGESDRSVEAVNHLAELTTNTEELAQWQTIAAGVTAKFGDSLPIEGLTEAANETAKVGAVTGPFADALNWASAESSVFEEVLGGNQAALYAFNATIAEGKGLEEAYSAALGKMTTEEERASAITATLNGLYSEAGVKYNEMTASQQAARLATSDLEQAQALLGEALEPVTTAWTEMKTNGLQWIVDTGLPALQTGWQWIQDNIPTVVAVVAGLTTAIAAQATATGIKILIDQAHEKGLTLTALAQEKLNTAMRANAIGLVITAITLLVAGFMYLWDNCEGFRNFWKGLWEGIKTAAKAVSDWFKEAWTATLEWFKEAVANIKEFFSNAWEGIKNVFSGTIIGDYFKAIWETIKAVFAVVKAVFTGNWSDAWEGIKSIVNTWREYFASVWEKIKAVFSAVGSWFGKIFSQAWEGIKNAFASVKEFFSSVKEKILAVFSGIKEKFLSIGKNIVEGIWNGINNAYDWIKDKIKGWVGNVTKFLKKLFGIKSPSKVMRDEIGVWLVPGIAEGVEKTKNTLLKALNGVFNEMVDYLNKEYESQIKTITQYNAEKEAEYKAHAQALKQIETDKNKSISELDKKAADYQKKIADIHQKAFEEEQKQYQTHGNNIKTINDNIRKSISDRMTELLSLEADYQTNVKKIWEDLDKSITDLNNNYNEQLKSRAESIANSLNLWNAAEKNKVSGSQLEKNLKSQVKVLEDYNKAIAELEGKGLNAEFIQQLKEMGVGATGEIEALAKMTDDELANYVNLWQEKNALAKEAALEELEPLKADTMAQIRDLSDKAVAEYHRLTEEYRKQSVILVEELKSAMEESGLEGYEEIMSQVDDYTAAGASLMDGIITGIVAESPYLAQAVADAVERAISSGEAIAGISVPVHTDDDFSLEGYMSNLGVQMSNGVKAENAKIATGAGVSRSTVDAEIASAIGQNNTNLGSLASAFHGQTKAAVTVPINIDGREFGRAVVEFGTQESNRTGTSLAFT